MTPEIARLATEAFYKHNERLLVLDSSTNAIPCNNFNRYPSPTMNHMIRRMYITMRIRLMYTNFLRKLLKGALGFQNLKNLEITMEWNWPPTFADVEAWHRFHNETTDDPVCFPCDGSVLIEPASTVWIMWFRERILFKGVNAKL